MRSFLYFHFPASQLPHKRLCMRRFISSHCEIGLRTSVFKVAHFRQRKRLFYAVICAILQPKRAAFAMRLYTITYVQHLCWRSCGVVEVERNVIASWLCCALLWKWKERKAHLDNTK